MKVTLLRSLSICLFIASGILAQDEMREQPRTVQVTFTIEVTPNSDQDWQCLEPLFDQFIRSAQTEPDGENKISLLISNLERILRGVPDICKERGMHGQINCSVNYNSE